MKHILTRLAMMALLLTPLLFVAPVSAACPTSDSSEGQILRGVGETGSDCSTDDLMNIISVATEIISVIAGIAGVIMVVYSGFRYITSGGDTGKIGAAKTSLIYALIGLAIAALAQFMVNFVINTASDATEPCPTNSQISAADEACKS